MIDNAFCPGLEVVVDGELAAFDGVGGRMGRGWMVENVKGGKRDDLDVDIEAGERDVGRGNEAYVVCRCDAWFPGYEVLRPSQGYRPLRAAHAPAHT